MNPLSSAEVASIAGELQALVGAQLQEFWQTAAEFGLGFYHQGTIVWLWFDLHPNHPLVVRRPDKPAGKRLQRPLTLFVRSRFLGRRLAGVKPFADHERILIFSFHRAKDEVESGPCEIEVRLVPHAQNVIARDGTRSISELKPKELPTAPPLNDRMEPRDWQRIEEEWRARFRPPARATGGTPPESSSAEREWQKEVAKKEKILARLDAEISEKSNSRYAEVGEWLKAHATLDVPEDWRELVSGDKDLSWNIEECFRRSKENARKLVGTKARHEAVREELRRMRESGPHAHIQTKPRAAAQNLLARSEARGRSFKVADDLEAYVGKSAADNLRLLREAQPFDYWLHLRERPGSHAILRRSRSRVVTDAEFLKVGVWVAEQSLKKRAGDLKGERYDLLIVECRYVRPIKGDKLGRVHYTHDRVLTIRF